MAHPARMLSDAKKTAVVFLFGLTLMNCDQKLNSGSADEDADRQFLISNDAVGYFQIGNAWRDPAASRYGYQFVQEYGVCADGCCDGGFLLGDEVVSGEQGKTVRNPELTIGAAQMDLDPEDGQPDDPNLFLVKTEICDGWFFKDRIRYIIVYTDRYQTKEGIGVGSSLRELQDQFGPLKFYVGFIEEDAHAMQVVLRDYPNVQFVLDVDDYKGDWTQISSTELNNSLTISDFRSTAKIRNLIVGKTY